MIVVAGGVIVLVVIYVVVVDSSSGGRIGHYTTTCNCSHIPCSNIIGTLSDLVMLVVVILFILKVNSKLCES